MEALNALAVFLAGVFVRLALPVAVTLVAVYFLHRLDARWQHEAGGRRDLRVEKPRCWESRNCPPEQRRDCPGFKSALPCWQARRLPDGYLRDECLDCQVLRTAPVPAQQ